MTELVKKNLAILLILKDISKLELCKLYFDNKIEQPFLDYNRNHAFTQYLPLKLQIYGTFKQL